jgi:2'-5' RNA ligase
MGYSIELYFECVFEEKLRSLWDALDKTGVPSILQKIGSRPHISLLILDNCDVEYIADIIELGIKGHFKFPITFPAISLIPGKQQTVFLTPVINSKLIAIQESFYNLLRETGHSVREYYEPHNWLPHCTISKELSAVEALKTLEVCQNSLATGKTWITDVGFIEFRPRKFIKTIGLMDSINQTSHNNPLHRDSAAMPLCP